LQKPRKPPSTRIPLTQRTKPSIYKYSQIFKLIATSVTALIPVIGFMEEVYWRGYLQETLLVGKLRVGWVLSTIPYALVHVTSGLVILPLAAWFAGFVLGFTARTHGLPASIIAHVLWLYLVLYLLPTYKVL